MRRTGVADTVRKRGVSILIDYISSITGKRPPVARGSDRGDEMGSEARVGGWSKGGGKRSSLDGRKSR